MFRSARAQRHCFFGYSTSRSIMRRLIYGPMLALACLGLCTTSAWADLFGINFQGRGINNDSNTNAEALAPTDVAGVIAQANWNNDPTLVSGGTHTLSQLM